MQIVTCFLMFLPIHLDRGSPTLFIQVYTGTTMYTIIIFHLSYIVDCLCTYFRGGVLDCTVHKTKQEDGLCPVKQPNTS